MRSDSEKAERFLRHLEPLQGALEAYARRQLNDPGQVEDTLQSVLALAFRDFDLYAEGTNFRAWIFRYLNLEILGRNRRTQRRPRLLSEELPADDAWETFAAEPTVRQLLEAPEAVLEHCDEALAEALRQLDETERAVLLLRAVGEFKYREIAEILEVPIGTVMSHLSRSRARLRRWLADFGVERGLLKRDGGNELDEMSA